MYLPRVREEIPGQRKAEEAHAGAHWRKELHLPPLQQALLPGLQLKDPHEDPHGGETLHLSLSQLLKAI